MHSAKLSKIFATAKAATRLSAANLQVLESHVGVMRSFVHHKIPTGESPQKPKALAEFLDADLAFHMTIIAAAGNARLAKLAGDGFINCRIIGLEWLGCDQRLIEEVDHAHQAILESLLNRDADLAAKLVGQHIRRSLKLTLMHFNHGSNNSWLRSHSVFNTAQEEYGAAFSTPEPLPAN